MFCRPRNLGLSMDFDDYLWKEVEDCHIKEGIMGATFTLNSVKGSSIEIDYLPKAQARMLYRYAQEQEEKMTEYR
ncbi:PH domain-containing protein [Antarcticibacterium sp. 1MA-6-2]|nr:PH domain-containing protein [Antarcticibacterium sp. 1MA-6-2]